LTNRKVIIVGIFEGLFVYATINSLLGPSIIKIMNEFKVDFTVAGIALSAFSLGVLTTVYTGKFADKYGPMKTSRLGILLIGITTILIGFSQNIITLYIFSFTFGVSAGFFESSFNQTILDLYPNAKGTMATIIHSAYGFGSIIGPIIAVALITQFDNWRFSYLIFGSIMMLNASLQFLFGSKDGRARQQIQQDVVEVDVESLILILVASFLTFIIGMGVSTWLPTYLVGTSKVSYFESSIVLSSFWLTFAVGRLFIGKMADKEGYKKILVMFPIIQTACGITAIFLNGLIPNVIIWGIVGLMQAPYYPLLVTIAYNKFRNSSGQVMGKIVATGFAGSLIVAPLIGTLAKVTDQNMATLVIAAASFGLFITFLKMKI
jgi:MFS family permease